MIISATLSKPAKNSENLQEKPFERIKIRATNTAEGTNYFVEQFTKTQVFHKKLSAQEVELFIKEQAGTVFKNCIIRTEDSEITILANKKGEITRLEKPILPQKTAINWKTKKNYLIPEGKSVPFLELLGIMNSNGKVIQSKFDKFKQINRFLEFINDVVPNLEQISKNRPINIVDFGCGKSYLTFAVQYFFENIKKLPVQITGLDLKKEVIDYCNETANKLSLKNIVFSTGDIANYNEKSSPDMIITLHACDTATDFALDYAVKHNCSVILSVPCCQHEINLQLNNTIKHLTETKTENPFELLLKHGIIKERFASLVTDALRAEYLEQQGYSVQLLEFINIENTPKNLLIRAVKKEQKNSFTKNHQKELLLEKTLEINPKLKVLLNEKL